MAVSRDITAVPPSYVMVAPRDVILEGGIPASPRLAAKLAEIIADERLEKKKVGNTTARLAVRPRPSALFTTNHREQLYLAFVTSS